MTITRELLSWDPMAGIAQYHNYDSDTDTSYFESVGDAEPVLELNKTLANDGDMTKQGIKDGFWLYARIPTIFQYKLLVEKGIDVYNKDHAGRLSRVLEDPEYRHLKTTVKRHLISEHD